MSEYTTIARPYAKAAFEFAHQADLLPLWSDALRAFAQAAADPQALGFIENPASTSEQQVALFTSIIDGLQLAKAKKGLQNFIQVLAAHHRLAVLPEIFLLYEQLKAEFEKNLDVQVRSFSPLSTRQKESLQTSLAKRLQKNIVINEVIDKNLLGGAIIQAGDFVIDGSVRGKLAKLAAGLAA
ncbi:MAG: F0F1 ATP synthase subunit delta [Legionellaceae bacterium]|nr:F0F1 ATP synthase subunit delta [Legionellaceae bacterium]